MEACALRVGELPLLDQLLALIETGIVIVLSCSYVLLGLAAHDDAANPMRLQGFTLFQLNLSRNDWKQQL